MFARPMVVRRRPLLRAAAVGGTYAAGRAMGQRAQQQAYAQASQDQPPPQAPPAPAAAPPGGASPPVLDQLTQLTALHDQGALSDEEFAAAKAKVIGG